MKSPNPNPSSKSQHHNRKISKEDKISTANLNEAKKGRAESEIGHKTTDISEAGKLEHNNHKEKGERGAYLGTEAATDLRERRKGKEIGGSPDSKVGLWWCATVEWWSGRGAG